ncbi:MAG: YkgJ family cysteine cluster protein [Burkholderiales bacterium]|nr:YkgJ family cysteine cluster protein [Burkholderiales bacterium]
MSAPKPLKFAAVARRIARDRASGAPAVVDCGICTRCCREPQRVALAPGELANPALRHDGKHLLRQPDGACTHLVDGACEVYGERPQACRKFDCRSLAVALSSALSAPGVTRAGFARVAPPRDAEDVAYATAVHRRLQWIVGQSPGVDAVDAGYAAAGISEDEVILARRELAAMPPAERARWVAEQVRTAAEFWCKVNDARE